MKKGVDSLFHRKCYAIFFLNFFAFKIIESFETVDYALKIGVINELPRETDAVEDIRGEGVVGLRHVSVGMIVRDET